MDKTIELILQYARKRDFENFMKYSRELVPYMLHELILELNKLDEEDNFYKDMEDNLTIDELREFYSLNDSKRVKKYILDKEKREKLTNRDFMELRACDF